MTPKSYQTIVINTIGEFFADLKAKDDSPRRAFNSAKDTNASYIPMLHDAKCPALCVKVPTGGGKTLLSAYAAGTASKHYFPDPRGKRPLVLFLVRHKHVVNQTYDQLSDPANHLHQQLVKDLGNPNVALLDPKSATESMLSDSQALVLVSTVAALTGKDKECRNFSKASEQFGNLSMCQRVAARRPIVILDEAHNAKSAEAIFQSDTLRDIQPSCVLEFTATPREDKKGNNLHNVLVEVSARQLIDAKMAKNPFRIKCHNNGWQSPIKAAFERRQQLEDIAKSSGDSIRPVALYQANRQNAATGDGKPDNLVAYLRELGANDDSIAVVTAKYNGLEGVDIKAADCPIRHVVTIDALREGWDCPQAYVFASAQPRCGKQGTMAQFLGRVARLPNQRKRKARELNTAYVHVRHETWKKAYNHITDELEGVGLSGIKVADDSFDRIPVTKNPLRGENVHANAEFLPYSEAKAEMAKQEGTSAIGDVQISGPIKDDRGDECEDVCDFIKAAAVEREQAVSVLDSFNRQTNAQLGIKFGNLPDAPELTINGDDVTSNFGDWAIGDSVADNSLLSKEAVDRGCVPDGNGLDAGPRGRQQHLRF